MELSADNLAAGADSADALIYPYVSRRCGRFLLAFGAFGLARFRHGSLLFLTAA
jgi:hypothetical protein